MGNFKNTNKRNKKSKAICMRNLPSIHLTDTIFSEHLVVNLDNPMLLLHMLDSIGLSFPSVVPNPITAQLLALISRDMVILRMKDEEFLGFESGHSCARTACLVANIWH
jgi:hypothetical protein